MNTRRVSSTVLDFVFIPAAATAAVVGVSSLMPASAKVYRGHVTDSSPDTRVKIADFYPDKQGKVVGQCTTNASTRVKITDFSPDERWKVADFSPDIRICLSGDIDEWFEHVN